MRVVVCVALLLLTGCENFLGIGDRDVEVSITLQRAWDPPPVLQVDIGRRRVAVAAQRGGLRANQRVQARTSGELPVTLLLLGAQGDTIAATQYLHEFERGHAHWVAVDVGLRRPIGHCIGNLIVLPTRSGTDTAFVMYGSLPDGAIC